MKYTKGQWYIDSQDEQKAAKIRSTIHKEGKGICLIYPNKEWEANAKLIAEAPQTKKKYNELKTLCYNSLAQRLKAEAQRDELLVALGISLKHIDKKKCPEQIIGKIEQIVKSNSND